MTRVWAAFTVLAVVLFGSVGYGCYQLVMGHPGTAFLAAVTTLVCGRVLPRPLARLVNL